MIDLMIGLYSTTVQQQLRWPTVARGDYHSRLKVNHTLLRCDILQAAEYTVSQKKDTTQPPTVGLIMVALWNRAGHYIFALLVFFFLLFLYFFLA